MTGRNSMNERAPQPDSDRHSWRDGLGPQALAELDVIRMQPAITRLQTGLRTAIAEFVDGQDGMPGAWVGLLTVLGHTVGDTLDAVRLMPDAPEVLDLAINRAIVRRESDPDRSGDRPVDDAAMTELSDAFLADISRHMRAADARDNHVFEALGALATATAVVLRAAARDPVARRFFDGALASRTTAWPPLAPPNRHDNAAPLGLDAPPRDGPDAAGTEPA